VRIKIPRKKAAWYIMEESRNSCSYMVGGHLDYVPLLFTQKGENWEEGKPKKTIQTHIYLRTNN
jgi:hypothetical protein